MMFVWTLVLLFILKIRYPRNQPISNTIKNKYGEPGLKCFRNLENIWRKRDKLVCDIKYLEWCYVYETIPKFLKIKLYRRLLENS